MRSSFSFPVAWQRTLAALTVMLATACTDSVIDPNPEQDLATHAPAAPTALQITPIGPNSLHLTWQDNADDEVGFRVLRGPSTNDLSLIRTIGANAGDYDDTGLVPLTTYHYQVVAFNDDGESAAIAGSTTTPDEVHQCPGVDAANRVLVDASKDGGVWWFPQGGSFDPDAYHQGKPLADYSPRLGIRRDRDGLGPRDDGQSRARPSDHHPGQSLRSALHNGRNRRLSPFPGVQHHIGAAATRGQLDPVGILGAAASGGSHPRGAACPPSERQLPLALTSPSAALLPPDSTSLPDDPSSRSPPKPSTTHQSASAKPRRACRCPRWLRVPAA